MPSRSFWLVLALAAATLFFGVYPQPLLDAARGAAPIPEISAPATAWKRSFTRRRARVAVVSASLLMIGAPDSPSKTQSNPRRAPPPGPRR